LLGLDPKNFLNARQNVSGPRNPKSNPIDLIEQPDFTKVLAISIRTWRIHIFGDC